MDSNYSSITDTPRDARFGEKDNFGITPYEQGLAQFINHSCTPVTIALQGEWGSGKTSLMNSLRQTLTRQENSRYHGIWLNTWEYALMKDAPTILMDIITGLIHEISNIAEIEPTQTQKIVRKLWGVGKDTMTFAAKKAADQVVSGSSQLIDNLLTESSRSSIADVRDELEKVIAGSIVKNNKKGIIFFIDDLDRIDPPVAVQLLELLKNIFTLKNCIFVLAIDYDVVIKGLEPKFGKFSDQNEREFRSFFDKIIQVPFSMPVTSYKVNSFLRDGLATINYLPQEKLNDTQLITEFSAIAELTVGTNPRALKRLLNSLSLINCINASKLGESEEGHLDDELSLLVNFALVSTQIAYPSVYRLLTKYPSFEQWDERVAIQMNLKPLDDFSKEKLARSEEFDEEWEQVLFRLCEGDFYLKKRALYISNLLNKLRTNISDRNESIEDTIDAVISLSSVTNLEAFDKPTISYHRGHFLKGIRQRLLPGLKQRMENVPIAPHGKRVQSNAYIKMGEDGWLLRLHTRPFEGKIQFTISSGCWICPIQGEFEDSLKVAAKYDNYVALKKDYDTFITQFNEITAEPLGTHIRKVKKHYEIGIHHSVILSSVEAFYSERTINQLTEFIARLYPYLIRLTCGNE